MTPEKAKRIKQLSTEIANLLYEEVKEEELTSLKKIEIKARDLILEHVSPNIGIFLSKQQQAQIRGESEG
jgi:hypothetical protein